MIDVGPGREMHRLTWFTHEAETGRRYRIFRAEPPGCPPPEGYAILYLLDGNAAFKALTSDLLRAVPDLILIGIGYETDAPFSVTDRWLDYTPPLGPDGPAPDPSRPDRMAGGADLFLAALTGELRRVAEAGLTVDPRRRSLWGHSFGGLCVLYALFTLPSSFSRFIPVSPSLWWGAGVMELVEGDAAPRPGPAASVLIMLGDQERRADQPSFAGPGPARVTLQLAERLGRRRDLRTRLQVLEGMAHGPALIASLPSALAEASRCGSEASVKPLEDPSRHDRSRPERLK